MHGLGSANVCFSALGVQGQATIQFKDASGGVIRQTMVDTPSGGRAFCANGVAFVWMICGSPNNEDCVMAWRVDEK